MRLPTVALFLLAIATTSFAPTSVRAWGYDEHVEISSDAFDQACSDSRRTIRSDEVKRICESTLIKICYAHMVAVAGDHAAAPKDFLAEDQNLLFNKKHAIDCRNVDKMLDENPELPERLDGDHLHKTGLNGFFTYVNLLTNNTPHFRPESKSQWSDHANAALHEIISLQAAFARHSFSSHFLQDSFAAGHNGIKRGKQRQDYDQAYHDDMNFTGAFFQNKYGHVWHAYGDMQLKRHSRYLLESFCNDPKSLDQVLLDLGHDLDTDFEEFNEDLVNLGCEYDSVRVLSLAKRSVNPLDPCFVFDNCEKIELLMPSSGS